MAPIKFEEQLKEKLEKRTIQPSDDAWKTLANRLDNHDKSQNRKAFWWIGIAASIVGVALVTMLVSKDTGTEIALPKTVDVQFQDETKTDADASGQVETTQQQTEELPKSEITPVKKEQPVTKMANVQQQSTLEKPMTLKEALASNDEKVQAENQQETKNPINASDFEQAKVNDVVAEIQKINNENQGVTEAEIDSLLKQAEREILKNQIYNETTRTVDANALLEDVEAELEQSFRTRVFEALKDSYVTVKTAVAERNN